MIEYDPEKDTTNYYKIGDKEIFKNSASDTLRKKNTISQIMPIDSRCAWILISEKGIVKVCHDMPEGMVIGVHKGPEDIAQLKSPQSMLRGSDNDYWIATKDGLLHADNQLDSFKLINKNFGLQYSKLDHGFKLIEDKLYLGMDSGFAVAKESDLIKPLPVARCDFDNPTLGKINLESSEVIESNHKNNSFHIHLSTPIYDEVSSIQYAYKLVGHSDQTIIGGPDPYLRFDNLRPGEYRFEAKVKSQNRPWSDIRSIGFKILPPIWKRWWFILISALATCYLGYLFYHNRVKAIKNQADVKNQLLELEKQALLAQMNPHFIFNALNSIRSLILIGRYDESTEYLTKFSNMVRKVLQYSNDSTITLSEEISFLNDYLSLEKLRFSVKFDYDISIDDALKQNEIRIPPLLIQPFVENAIWHGLLHKTDNAELKIRFQSEENTVKVIVADNGIGRKASKMMQNNSNMKTKKEVGLKLGKKRLELLGNKASLEIIDKMSDDIPLGTDVIILIPKNI